MLQQKADRTHELHHFFNLRKIGLERRPDRGATPNPEIFRRRGTGVYSVLDTAESLQNPEYAIAFGMVLIIGQLVFYVQADEKATSHPDGQSGDIDKAIKFSFPQVTPRDLKKVMDHCEVIKCLKKNKMYATGTLVIKGEKPAVFVFDIGQYLYGNGTINPSSEICFDRIHIDGFTGSGGQQHNKT